MNWKQPSKQTHRGKRLETYCFRLPEGLLQSHLRPFESLNRQAAMSRTRSFMLCRLTGYFMPIPDIGINAGTGRKAVLPVIHYEQTHWIAVGPQQGRKVSRCRRCRRVTSRLMTESARLPGFAARRRGGASGPTPEARAAVSLHQSASHRGAAPVAHTERQRPLPAEDAVPRRHDDVIFEPLDFIAHLDKSKD